MGGILRRLKDPLVRRFLLRRRLGAIAEKRRVYELPVKPEEVAARQIHRFNAVWRRCYETIPFYAWWRREHGLPAGISELTELDGFPVLTKSLIRKHQKLVLEGGTAKKYVSTGGSTGEPARFPTGPMDALTTYVDLYVGRSWHGVQPLDVMLLFWGHSHLFGTGIRGVLADYRRRAYDPVVNIRRLNAYDVSARTIARYYAVFRDSNPQVIAGYTSCIYKLARYIADNGPDRGDKARLKAVILTAETVTASDIELLEEVFQVPVVVEYGMAETGAIAYSRENPHKLRVFWDSVIARRGDGGILRVTTISERVFPLINYRTDDVGRAQDVLRIELIDGGELEVTGILLVHVLKAYSNVYSIQFEQVDRTRIGISLVSDRELDLERVKRYFLRELARDHGRVASSSVEMRQVEAVGRTLAVK